jgi:hypothetical protein
MNSEEWRIIPGFENYSVSNLGRVRRDKGGSGRCKAGRILKPKRKWNGYLFVGLYNGKGAKDESIHVLVAAAFIGPRPGKLDVAHINGVRDDNRAENLKYATRSENNFDKRNHGTDNRGSKNYGAKWTEEDVLAAMKMKAQGFRHREIAIMFNISRSAVTMALSGKQWKHVHEHLTGV